VLAVQDRLLDAAFPAYTMQTSLESNMELDAQPYANENAGSTTAATGMTPQADIRVRELESALAGAQNEANKLRGRVTVLEQVIAQGGSDGVNAGKEAGEDMGEPEDKEELKKMLRTVRAEKDEAFRILGGIKGMLEVGDL
jgi:flagellar biosynthesis/type III secretory pathway protein FliH